MKEDEAIFIVVPVFMIVAFIMLGVMMYFFPLVGPADEDYRGKRIVVDKDTLTIVHHCGTFCTLSNRLKVSQDFVKDNEVK